MTDSVAVFPPGYRLTDSATGEPISGATILFYDAGTTTPHTVYADSGLQTALGTSVITDALGCPTSDGVTKTDVFVGTAAYKVVIKDASGVTIETKDDRPGAVVSASSVNVAVTALFPVVIKSLDYTVVQEDQNTTFVGNCSSGDVNFTLPSMVPGTPTQTGNVSAAGWKIKVQHGGSANHVIIKTVLSQSLSGGVAGTATQLVLVRQGEEVEISSDGGNARVSGHTLAAPHGYATGIIQVVSRLATAPGSPTVGDKYIVTANGGAWSSFAAGDIATWNGATWGNQTPPSNCGWLAYSQADGQVYEYVSSAWVGLILPTPADKTAMEAATANRAVTADVQHYHPAHPKFWALVTVVSGTPTLASSFNVASITDVATGRLKITFTVPFSSAAWCPQVSQEASTGTSARWAGVSNGQRLAASVEVCNQDSTQALSDPASWFVAGFGDQ